MHPVITMKVKCEKCGRIRGRLVTVDGTRVWCVAAERRLSGEGTTMVVAAGTTYRYPIDRGPLTTAEERAFLVADLDKDGPPLFVPLARCRCRSGETFDRVPRSVFDGWLRGSQRVVSVSPQCFT